MKGTSEPNLLPIVLLVFSAILAIWLGVAGPLFDSLTWTDKGFLGAVIGAVATIFAGGAAFFVAMRGIQQQRAMEAITILNIERDRIGDEMPGLLDAQHLADEFDLDLWLTERLDHAQDAIETTICRRLYPQPQAIRDDDIRKVIEKILPRTAEIIRGEIVGAVKTIFGIEENDFWSDEPRAQADVLADLNKAKVKFVSLNATLKLSIDRKREINVLAEEHILNRIQSLSA